MRDGPASPPREQGWWPALFALAALFLVPLVPPLRALLPIEQMTMLLVPTVTACFVIGWWAGGRSWPALLWTAATIFAFWVMPGPEASAYRDLARAWGLIVAGAFGLVCVGAGARPFLARGLAAVGLAVLLALLLAAIGELPPGRAESVFAAQYALRNAQSAAALQQSARFFPQLEGLTEWGAQLMSATSDVALRLYPALLALQGLAVCAVSWALYHRLSRVRIGPPLGRLREFVFGDQFVWGLIAGATLALLPALSPLQGVGFNLLAFFGVLYAIRGAGVIAWFLHGRGRALAAGVVAAAVLAGPIAPVAAFGVGVGDTWFDWRGRFGSSGPPDGGRAER